MPARLPTQRLSPDWRSTNDEVHRPSGWRLGCADFIDRLQRSQRNRKPNRSAGDILAEQIPRHNPDALHVEIPYTQFIAPDIHLNPHEHILKMCWTVPGEDDFRQTLDEVCMNLNDLASAGAAIEVTFYDAEFDEEEGAPGSESRDDFVMLFVGPDPAAIMQVQRDILVQDMVNLMERHFDGAELCGVVSEIDKLFAQRFDDLVNSLEIGKPPRGSGGSSSGHGGGRKPRHLH